MEREKIFAPRVLIPPWASSSAWKSRTIVPTSGRAMGPTASVPKVVPVRCELLPATEGILSAERMKTKAAERAKVLRMRGAALICRAT